MSGKRVIFWPDITNIESAKKATKPAAYISFFAAAINIISGMAEWENNGWFSLIDSGLYFIIGFSILKRYSRFASIAGLIFYILGRFTLDVGTLKNPFVVLVTIAFIVAYINSIRGSFSFHRFLKSELSATESPSFIAQSHQSQKLITNKTLRLFLNGSIVVLLIFFSFFLGKISNKKTGSKVYEEASRSVVSIRGYDKNNKPVVHGSGVFIAEDGKVLTNYHVIKSMNHVEVIDVNRKKLAVSGVMASDKNVDFVLLKVSTEKSPPIKIGKSSDVKIGDKIYTISSPLGEELQNTFASGEISGIRQREILEKDDKLPSLLGKQIIQFTAPTYSGSSGGAVLNENGELIGLVVQKIRQEENLNFAIPIDELKNFLNSKSFLDYDFFAKLDEGQEEKLKAPIVSQEKNTPVFSPDYSISDLLKEGNDAFKKQDYQQAILFWSVAFKRNPRNVVALNKIAFAYWQMGDIETAINLYRAAMEIDPNNYMAYFNVAEIFYEDFLKGCPGQEIDCRKAAVGFYLKALELNPSPRERKKAEDKLLFLTKE